MLKIMGVVMKIFIIFFIILSSFSLIAADFQETRKFSLPADNISKLYVDCGAGYLEISGDKNLNEIRVKAEILINEIDPDDAEKFIDRYMELYLKERGSRAELISQVESKGSFFSNLFNGYGNVRINLQVEVPETMNLDIDDGSGHIKIKNIEGNIYIDDGSDYIELTSVTGRITIDDGSGDIEIADIKGDVEIDDGSGEIDIHNVIGNVYLDDGSGRITVEEIDGNVRIDDGSGSINIYSVEEDVIIEDDGSGSVNIRDIAGNVYRYDE
jgi:hypothetical protein